jgi:flagellar hook-associated protein 3 FlgL
MRVTEGMIYNSANQSLGNTLSVLNSMTEKVGSTKQLNRPSDNPADVRSAVQLRDVLAELNQFSRNIDTASGRVQAMDDAMASVGEVIQRANELAISGANSSLGASDRAAMGQEISQLIEQIGQDAGTKFEGSYVFSGFKVNTPPYAVTGAGTLGVYQGDRGVVIARIGQASTMQVSVAGDEVFQPAIDALSQLKSDLFSGNAVQPGTITQIQGALDNLLSYRSQVGARANRLDDSKASLSSLVISNQALLSQLEDADMPSVITELTKRQTTYQATLAVTAKVMQTSLIDYLR